MLAEIFMLRAETAAREAAKDAARFVPITLPSTPTIPPETGVAPALRNRLWYYACGFAAHWASPHALT